LYDNPVSVSNPCVPVAPSTKTGYTVSSVLLLALIVAFVASVANATAILPVPSKDVPPIVLAVASAVAVAALPVQDPDEPDVLPVTLPVRAPVNDVATAVPVILIPVEVVSNFCPSVP